MNKKHNYKIDLKKKTTIKAHQSALSFLELSSAGNKLATSSEKVYFFKKILKNSYLYFFKKNIKKFSLKFIFEKN